TPTDYSFMKKRLQREWGEKPEAILQSIDKKPIAAASIGQVHRAVLKTGEEVVVKIQYPGLEAILDQDLKAFRGIVSLISLFFPDAELHRIYEEIRSILLEEIDFTIEAKNMTRFRNHFSSFYGVTAPALYAQYSTAHVLVAEFIDGVKINDVKGLEALGTDGETVSTLLIESFAHQLFDHGFYHADPHPGNLLVRQGPGQGPEIVFIDFGAACEISETTREGMVEFVQSGVRKDTQGLIKAMRKMGFIAIEADPRVYDRVVSFFHDKFHQEIGLENLKLGNIKFSIREGMEHIADLKRLNITLKDIGRTFHIPREWVLLERTFLLLMGIVTETAPNLDIYEVFIPHLKRFSIKYGLDPSSLAIASMRELAINAFALPAELRNMLQKISYGEVSVRWAEAEKGFSLLFYLVQEVFFGLLGWTMLTRAWDYQDRGIPQRARLLTIAAGFCGILFLRAFLLAWSSLKRRS
ncbi:AarF/ABC1/UbiB kinase family protein, partial [Myxococcota bacterium]|nr:AarF/ABC1/UbiB kinase family protein [Myxococcota bacterium]MBU1535211.1 AarF/ABC1/UbiB kinase family protein [Myxococcota bacterium]